MTSSACTRPTLGQPRSARPARLGCVLVTRRIIPAAAVAAAAAAAVGMSACGSSTTGAAPEVQAAADRPDPVVVRVPRLTGGGSLEVGSPAERPTVVNLWASWCGPCREEMPAVEAFARSHPDVRVVGIAIDDTTDSAREFAREVGVTFPLGIDRDDAVGDGYGVTGLPMTFVLDSAGRLAATWAGPVTDADLSRLTDPLVDES